MIKFLTLAVKIQLNVHDLNNETGAGNVTDIRIIEFLDEEGKRLEAPAVSGRMLKHWHFEAMNNLILRGPYSNVPLCDACKAGEPIRPGEIKNGTLVQVAKPESEAILSCAVCDIHGFLIAQEAEGESKGISSRRASRAMFSWLMPLLDAEIAQRQVVHTRVSQQQEMAKGEGAAQMIFNKSYASGIYAFVSALDVERIGLVELNLGSNNPYAIDDSNGRKDRIKVAIEAYRLMLSGQLGASLSHALPHHNPIEILVGYSEKRPLPFPVSPMYSDYLTKTIGLMPQDTVFLYWGNATHEKVKKKNTINEIFDELMSKV
jgi:CRISPR-associated protein Cst2